MILFLVLAILLPWSLYRQMHDHPISREGLIKLPIIFAAVGALSLTTQDVPTDAAAVAYVAFSLALSVALGVWRGAVIPTWRNAAGEWMSKGNRLTITLWIVLIGAKVAMGTVASITGWFPASTTGEVFLSLGLSFAAQNLVVARRTIAQRAPVARPAFSR
jgi:hypothetical protein